MKKFPIHKLNSNINKILQTIITANIPGCISNGLSNVIYFIDEATCITCPAEIIEDKLTGKFIVKLSVAYCQYLWLLCDIALKTIDSEIIIQECNKHGINKETYKSFVNNLLQLSKIEFFNILKIKMENINHEQYYDYLKRSLSIIDNEKLSKEIEIDYSLLLPLTDKSMSIDIEKYYQINFNGNYEEKVNSMYCFGITFVLLHELSHFSLGHFNKSEEITDETNADIAAFWDIYASLNEQMLFSAYCGVICALFSLLYINPSMSEDGIHPQEYKRIFDVYENIEDKNNKIILLIIHLFKQWSNLYNIQDFPNLDSENPKEDVYRIKKFFLNRNKN